MNRRTFCLSSCVALMVGPPAMGQATEKVFPPRPSWRPSFQQPLDRIVERMHYYFDGKKDFAVFANGTCAVLEADLSDAAAVQAATSILSEVFNYHPDMTPLEMDDGNILVQYRKPVFNVVLNDVALAHWTEINERHRDAIATDEVLFTPLGQNVFDDFGKKALFGRCYMFMDAVEPRVVRVERRRA